MAALLEITSERNDPKMVRSGTEQDRREMAGTLADGQLEQSPGTRQADQHENGGAYVSLSFG